MLILITYWTIFVLDFITSLVQISINVVIDISWEFLVTLSNNDQEDCLKSHLTIPASSWTPVGDVSLETNPMIGKSLFNFCTKPEAFLIESDLQSQSLFPPLKANHTMDSPNSNELSSNANCATKSIAESRFVTNIALKYAFQNRSWIALKIELKITLKERQKSLHFRINSSLQNNSSSSYKHKSDVSFWWIFTSFNLFFQFFCCGLIHSSFHHNWCFLNLEYKEFRSSNV